MIARPSGVAAAASGKDVDGEKRKTCGGAVVVTVRGGRLMKVEQA